MSKPKELLSFAKKIGTMKLFYLLSIFALSALTVSCGGNSEEETEEGTENQEDTTDTSMEDEGAEIAFDGIEKNGYLLYGHTDIDEADAFSTDEMFIEYETAGSFTDKVAISIDEVCQKAGCWITFKNPTDEDVRVVFRDHFTIPIETASGTEAILLGSLISDTISIELQKHYLDDAAEAGEEVDQAEYDAITEDKIELSFDCESILVKQ